MVYLHPMSFLIPEPFGINKTADTLYRSDFFPGLGWMLTKSTWDELSPKWPKAYPFLVSCI